MRSASEACRGPARGTIRLLALALLSLPGLPTGAHAAEPPPRSAEAREIDAGSDQAIFVVIAETFATFDDANSYIERTRATNGIDLKETFGPYGYEVTVARLFSAVGEIEGRLRAGGKGELARWVNPKLCFQSEGKAQAAAKKLSLVVKKEFDDLARCHWAVWSKPVPRDRVREVVKKVASAGYDDQLFLEVADVVIVLGKAVTPSERSKIESIAREHRIAVQILRSGLSEGD